MAFLYHLHFSVLFIPRNRELVLESLMLKLRVLGSENLQSVILRGEKEWYRKEKK